MLSRANVAQRERLYYNEYFVLHRRRSEKSYEATHHMLGIRVQSDNTVSTAMDAEILARDIEASFKLTTAEITPAMIQRQIDRLRREGSDLTGDPGPGKALTALVTRNLSFLRDGIVNALDRCEVYVVPLPLCVALSRPERTIVIGNGLLNLITAVGYWANFAETLPKELDEIKPLKRFPTTSVRDAVPIFLFILLYRHYQYGEVLPNFRALNGIELDKLDSQVRDALAGAATFVLLHELAHLELGHRIPGERVFPIDVPLAVPEVLTRYQQMELEADDFAMQALEEPLRPLHFPWINMALNFHFHRETLLSERTERYPVNVNRLAYAHARTGGDARQPNAYAAHLERMGRAYTDIEAKHAEIWAMGKRPLLESLSRAEVVQELRILRSSLDASLRDSLEQVLTGQELPDWRTALHI